jgi:hypothetical protein
VDDIHLAGPQEFAQALLHPADRVGSPAIPFGFQLGVMGEGVGELRAEGFIPGLGIGIEGGL